MRIAVVGGGPGGLYFAILMRKVAPDAEIVVYERNQATDAFGFGVVFSDETLTVFEHADPESFAAITERFARWTDIDIHHRGQVTRSGGHGFAALGRRELLGILQERAAALAVDVRFFCPALFAEELDGRTLLANNSKWINFVTVRCRRWCTRNVALIGDAAHTAHFSIGSGTKLAMEDAVALAWTFRNGGEDVAAATAAYEAERRPIVESTQRAAQASL